MPVEGCFWASVSALERARFWLLVDSMHTDLYKQGSLHKSPVHAWLALAIQRFAVECKHVCIPNTAGSFALPQSPAKVLALAPQRPSSLRTLYSKLKR
jgi:hypothetical protein